MIRFWTYEEAHLFASRKRAEGYFAEVIHQNVGHIWGGSVIHDFPVLISEDVILEDAPEPDRGSGRPSEWALVLAIFGVMGFTLFLVGGLLIGLMTVLHTVRELMVMPLWMSAAMVTMLIALFSGLWFMLKLTRVYNRPQHRWYGFSRVVMGGIIWILVVVG